MKEIGIITCLLLFWAATSVAHEQDIARQCREKGESGLAGWTISIKCSSK